MKKKQVLALILSASVFLSTSMGLVSFAKEPSVDPQNVQKSVSIQNNTETEGEETMPAESVTDTEEIERAVEEIREDKSEEKTPEDIEDTSRENKTETAETATQDVDSKESVSIQAAGTAYWNPLSGNDNEAGDSRNNAVKTLEKAKEVAGQGGTVYLVSKLTVTQDMTISDVTLKCEDSMNDDMLYVRDGAVLTLENATIDGTRKDLSRNPYIINVENATVIMEGTTKVCNGNQGAFYLNRGTLTMNSGEICGNGNVDENYNKAGAVQIIGGGRFNMNGGEIYAHQA